MRDCPSPGSRSEKDLFVYKNSNPQPSDSSKLIRKFRQSEEPVEPDMIRAMVRQDSACPWRQRVLEMFDPTLRDAEDMLLSLPYTAIREKTDKLATVLDEMGLSTSSGSSSKSLPQLGTSNKERDRPAPPMNRGDSESIDRALGRRFWSAKGVGVKPSSERQCQRHMIEKAMCVMPLTRAPVEALIVSRYTCYESLNAIIANYDQCRGHETEIQARRALTAALGAMDKIIS